MEIDGCETSRNELTKLIPELRTQCETSPGDDSEREELLAKVRKCKADMDSCASKASRLETEVSQLQQDILDAGGPRLKNQKSIYEKLLSDLEASQSALNACRVEATTSEKSETKARTAKLELEKHLLECEEALRSKEMEFKSLESGALEVMSAYEQVKVMEAEKRTSLEAASREIDDLKKTQAQVRCKEVDLLGQVEAVQKQISENRKKMAYWERELASLRELESSYDPVVEDDQLVNETQGLELNREDADANDFCCMEDWQGESMPSLSHAVLERYDTQEIKDSISTLEAEKNILSKNANMGAIAEYKRKESDYLSR